jgi:hypothetical protein
VGERPAQRFEINRTAERTRENLHDTRSELISLENLAVQQRPVMTTRPMFNIPFISSTWQIGLTMKVAPAWQEASACSGLVSVPIPRRIASP